MATLRRSDLSVSIQVIDLARAQQSGGCANDIKILSCYRKLDLRSGRVIAHVTPTRTTEPMVRFCQRDLPTFTGASDSDVDDWLQIY